MGQIDSFKKVLGVSAPARADPPSPKRTSISLPRRTYARRDCYYFWVKHHGGKHYPPYSAFLEEMPDEVLAMNKNAASFVEDNSGVF